MEFKSYRPSVKLTRPATPAFDHPEDARIARLMLDNLGEVFAKQVSGLFLPLDTQETTCVDASNLESNSAPITVESLMELVQEIHEKYPPLVSEEEWERHPQSKQNGVPDWFVAGGIKMGLTDFVINGAWIYSVNAGLVYLANLTGPVIRDEEKFKAAMVDVIRTLKRVEASCGGDWRHPATSLERFGKGSNERSVPESRE